MVGYRRVFAQIDSCLHDKQELGEEIRKMCSDLTNKSEEIVQHEKEKEALRKLADDGIKQAESEHAQKMEQQKEVWLF